MFAFSAPQLLSFHLHPASRPPGQVLEYDVRDDIRDHTEPFGGASIWLGWSSELFTRPSKVAWPPRGQTKVKTPPDPLAAAGEGCTCSTLGLSHLPGHRLCAAPNWLSEKPKGAQGHRRGPHYVNTTGATRGAVPGFQLSSSRVRRGWKTCVMVCWPTIGDVNCLVCSPPFSLSDKQLTACCSRMLDSCPRCAARRRQ